MPPAARLAGDAIGAAQAAGRDAGNTEIAPEHFLRALLDQPSPPPAEAPESVRAVMLRVTGLDIDRCPVCAHGHLRCVALLPPARPRAHAPPLPGPCP